ncbi:hypothetical protein BDP27DRAFT_1418230 [Rhodocollybia butyracea]|uniref:F-box domain-containing protein n=1 Tax=Rhodocollybia butyracea TaxID=206335 RepID=A0A9P5Q030_9AGAR|nr:hypothetical protein BDP27DRAFT_1418230 [Rhodocollybia butyracea]
MPLVDLPEELLCSICEKTEPSTLLSLAASCKLLNRIAGSHYLLFIAHDKRWICVADKETSSERSFDTLRNIMSIAGSVSSARILRFRFSPSAAKTLQQIRLVTLLLQRIHHPLSSIQLDFSGAERWSSFPPSFNMFPSFNGEFGRLLWEAHRLRCSSLALYGIIPCIQDHFKFSPLINTSFSNFTFDAAFLLSRAQRGWLTELLNASKAISSILACCSEGWTHILLKLRLPSLTGLTFFTGHVGTPTAIEVLAEFCNRHPKLHRIDSGPYQFRISLTSKLGCQYPLPQLQILKASVSQLLYFVSDPSHMCNLQVVEIRWPALDVHLASKPSNSSTGLWHLFTCLCNRSSIRELVLPVNLPGLEKDVLSKAQPSLTSTFPYLTKLRFIEFKSLAESTRQDFLKWVSKVFPGLKTLEVDYMAWDAVQTSRFARTVAKELPLTENLRLEFKTRKVKEWIENNF